MVKKTDKGISILSAQFTATVSVTLVLILLGTIALLGIAASSVTRSIRENMGFNLVLADSVAQQRVDQLRQMIQQAPYTASATYVSADEALADWRSEMGEDLMEILKVNPFSSEIEVKVKAAYASTDSIAAIIAPLKAMPEIVDASVPAQMVDSINSGIRTLTVALSAVAALLLLISFVLISNTVHLAIYARRFSIHTMRLVGATAGFIRRPFIINSMLCGLTAGLLAAALLAGAVAYLHTTPTELASAIAWSEAACALAGVVATGVAITSAAALLATNRYLRRDYNQMFR